MTIEDLSNGFDTLLNSYAFKPEFGNVANIHDIVLDEYEKSVFLTLAQEQLLRDLLGDYTGGGIVRIEENKVLQLGLQTLVEEGQASAIELANRKSRGASTYYIEKYDTGTSCLALLMEEISLTDGTGEDQEVRYLEVIPVSHQEYSRLRSKPWGGPNKRQAWRVGGKILVTTSTQSGGGTATTTTLSDIHLVLPSTAVPTSETDVTVTYYFKYVKKPSPIILCDLTADLAIDNQTKATTSALPESLHYTILERAVRLAITSKADKLQVARNMEEAAARQRQQ